MSDIYEPTRPDERTKSSWLADRDSIPETPPYWLRYSGRLVQFGTLDRTTRRLAVAGTVAAVLGLLILTLPLSHFAAVPMPPLLVSLHVPWAVLVTGSLLQAAGWWYLLSGAASGGVRVRIPVALAFLVFAVTASTGERWVLIPAALVIVFLFVTARRRPPVWIARLAPAVGVLAAYAVMLGQGPSLYAMTLLDQMVASYLLLVPVIFYSGFDLGQSALHAVRVGLLHLHKHTHVRLLAILTGAVVLGKLVFLLVVEHGPSWTFAAALLVIGAGLLLSRFLQPLDEGPPELIAASASLLVFGALLGSGLAGTWGDAAVLALIVGAVLSLGARRGRPLLATSAVFLILFGLWNLLNAATHAPSPIALIQHMLEPINAQGLDEAVILGALAYLGWLIVHRTTTAQHLLLVLFWLVGFSLVLGLWSVLGALQHLSHGALPAEAVLLAIGIGHEVAASGDLLNRGSPTVPRASRVLLYLGYLLVVCGSTVLTDGSKGPMAGIIQSDTLQEGGLILIGIPLYLQAFAHALAVGRPPLEDRENEGDGEEDAVGLTSPLDRATSPATPS